jgi:LacI family repressor for deo operon, udp, cdd, tsx, nupC, and nupG
MEGGTAAASRLLKQGVTALVCASDAIALGAIRAVVKQGMTVPGDVSVVGFDDSPFMVVTDPALTTVRQPVRAMSAAAVDLLKTQISGSVTLAEELTFAPELIVRNSTAVRR